MRSLLVLTLALALAGCATRLPTTESTATSDSTVATAARGPASAPSDTPTRGLATRFVRCEAVGMTREHEVEREEFYKHKVTLFMGYTGERGEEGGQTVGVDYLYRFDHHWGVGAFIDFAAGGLRSRVVGAGLDYHPIEPVFLFVGPGIEWIEGETQGLIRVGGGYEFEVGERTAVSPAAYVDFLENGTSAWIVGVLLGYDF